VKADPSAQLRLLDLQQLDSRADQLRHRRATLPEIHRIAELEERRHGLDNQRRDAQIAVDDLTLEQKRADADVEQVKTRRERDRQRMDAGLVTNPKDLERMTHELDSLERRIRSLEDTELEVMEKLEDAQGDLDRLTREVAEVDTELDDLRTRRAEGEREVDAGLESVAGERGPVAAGVPDDLTALYDKLRATKGGLAAAELRARRCGGCQLTIDHAELAVIAKAPADEVVRCEECQRILVRTAESGI
jgi:predicted  nucleic acid-binding Zn-ribbon protein